MPDVMAPEHDIHPAADDPTKNTFGIALALSGAVSAGAYSAGVLDFLVQALQEWKQERGKNTIPSHSACITVIASAPAGAITGAFGVVALARKLRPVKFDAPVTGQQTVKRVLPTLYEACVTEPRMTAPKGLPSLLSVEDLLPDRVGPASPVQVQWLLNARLFDSTKAHRLAAPAGPAAVPPRFPFIADCIHVLMTIRRTAYRLVRSASGTPEFRKRGSMIEFSRCIRHGAAALLSRVLLTGCVELKPYRTAWEALGKYPQSVTCDPIAKSFRVVEECRNRA